MAKLLKEVEGEKKIYWDRRILPTYEDAVRALEGSKTVYVGNLAWMTQELQIHATFSTCGVIKSIIMGLNRVNKMPCGFCFVEFFTHRAATESVELLHGTKIEGRQIKVELDPGFTEGRQYGRGKTGGQVADHNRKGYDPGRGGWSVQNNEQRQRGGGQHRGGRGRFAPRGGRGFRGGGRRGGGRRRNRGRDRYDHSGVGGDNNYPPLLMASSGGSTSDKGGSSGDLSRKKRKRDRYMDDSDDERDDLDERDDRRPK